MDKAILYNVTLEKVDKRINELKIIGFNMDEFIRVKEEIINENKAEIQKSYNFSNPSLALGQTAFLEQGYTNTINKLNKLYEKLLDYEIYAMAYHTAKLVKEFLESNQKDEKDFTKYREKIEQVLKNLHKSKTLDYEVEGPVIEEIYKIVYIFIKEEMKQFCYSALLNKLGEVDKVYIDKLVRRDVEQIDLRDEKNKLVSIKAKEIASKGFDENYANTELIMAIVNNNINKKKKALEEIDNEMGIFLNSINELNGNLKKLVKPIDKKKKLLSLIRNNIRLFINSAVAVGLVFGAWKVSKLTASNTETTYMTTKTNYDLLNEEPYTITEEYEPTTDDSLHILDYGPVTTEGKRTVTEYDLSNYQNFSLEELYAMDLNSLFQPEDIYILEGDDVYLEHLTNKAFRIINQISVDLENMKEVTEINKDTQYLLMVPFSIIALMLYILYCLIIAYCELHVDEDYLPILSDVENIYNDLKKLVNNKKDNKEYQEKLEEINIKLNNLITENKDSLEKAYSYVSSFEENEKYAGELTSLKLELINIEDIKKFINNNYDFNITALDTYKLKKTK